MKKVFLLAVGALIALTLSAKTIYLNTGGPSLWNQAGAVFFTHSWGGGAAEQDLQMVKVNDNVFSADINDNHTSIIFVRMPSGSTSLDWDKEWNQTEDLTIPADMDQYTIKSWTEGYWSKTSSGGDHGGGEETGDWLLQGDFHASDWSNPTKMESKTGGAANTIYATLTLKAGKEYEFKVNRNSSWYGNSGTMTQAHSSEWPMSTSESSNCRLATTVAGNYEFAFNTSNNKISVTYPYNPKQATLYESAVRENNPDVMIQAFYWAHKGNTAEEYTEYGDVKWNALIAESGVLAQYFDLVWLAPSQETADYTGYLPMNYSHQGLAEDESGHHGHSPWGTADELQTLIKNLHRGGSKVIADVVLNHTSAGHVDEYTGSDKNWCSWTLNDFGRYGQFQIDRTWLTAEDELFATDHMAGRIDRSVTGDCGDYDNSLLTPDDKYFPYGGLTDWDYQEYNSIYSRDLAHGKKEVREMSRAYLTWMRDSIGYDGFRWDFMKGISGRHLFDYLRSSAPYFSVAEVFDGNIDKQLGFMKDANHSSYMFDFPGKFTIYNEAIRPNNMNKLKGNQYTLIFGDNRKYAVSFIDNHDSFHENSNLYGTANCMDDRQARQALAYLLSMPGVPCVLYPYWNNHKEECKAFIKARKSAGVHSMSTVESDWNGTGEGKNFYTALIKGTKGYIMLKLGSDCVPTDAPMSASPDGKTWKCAWANSDAGVWYTGDDWIPDVPTAVTNNNEMKERVTKFIKNGTLYIQRGEHIYDAHGNRVK